MRKYFYIFIALLAYLVFSSRSCVPDDAQLKEKALLEAKKEIKTEFQADELSQKSLRAFEEKAKQKLIDLADYLNLYFDESVDTSFRTQAKQMILDLFISDTITVDEQLFSAKGKKNKSLNKFLSKNKKTYQHLSTPILIDSIQITEHLQRTSENRYEGELSFARYLSRSDSIKSEPIYMDIKIITKKAGKDFGTDTLYVWGVFLSDVEMQ